MRGVFAFVAGSIFGAGLLIAGMTDTTRVQGWLDIFGDWDPTLAFVLGGAILPMAGAWAFARGRKPVLGGTFPGSPGTKISRDLVAGSILFGMGWGLTGLCPGPSVASLSWGGVGGLVFLGAMSAGMIGAVPLKTWVNATGGKS